MNKKRVILEISITILIIILDVYVTFRIGNKYYKIDNSEIVNVSAYEIKNEKDYSGNVIDFSIYVKGLVTGTINPERLQRRNIKIIEFDAGIKTNWDTITNHFIGYRLNDVMKIFKLDDYKELVFETIDGLNVICTKEMVEKENIFIIPPKKSVATVNKPSIIYLGENNNYSMNEVFSIIVK